MTKQVVLVLGASGFIGRRIVAALAATNWARPKAASRNIAAVEFGPAVEKIALDATDQGNVERAIATASAVVSCIAASPQDIRLSGDALFAAISHVSPAPRIVYLSSVAAYGSAHGSVDETSPLLGDLGEYSAAKAAVESRAESLPNVVRLRPGIVYGPQSTWWSDRIARLLLERRLGDLGPAGEGICNAVHVDDVAAAVLRCIEMVDAGGEAFNLGSPQPPSWNEYFRRYAQFLHAPPVKRISRARLLVELNLFGPALKIAEKALGPSNSWGARTPIRPWLLELCRHDIRMDVRKAEQKLGMQWRSLDAGLEQTADWFVAGGRAP